MVVVLVFQLENQTLNDDLTKNTKYLHYLEMTCEKTGDEFGEPLDLQHRYETLHETNLTQVERREDGHEILNETQKEFRKYQQERSTDSQVINTKIANMRLEYDELKQKVSKTEVLVEKAEQEKMNRKHLIGQVVMAVENTFARCVQQTTLKSKADKLASEQDIMEQLDFIAEYFLDLKGINLAHQAAEKDRKKAQAAELERY